MSDHRLRPQTSNPSARNLLIDRAVKAAAMKFFTGVEREPEVWEERLVRGWLVGRFAFGRAHSNVITCPDLFESGVRAAFRRLWALAHPFSYPPREPVIRPSPRRGRIVLFGFRRARA